SEASTEGEVAAAWGKVGVAVLEALSEPLPKSLAAEPVAAVPAGPGGAPAKPARVVGSDAQVVEAVDKAARIPAGVPAEDAAAVAARQPYLLEAILGSERLLKALRGERERLYFAAEAQALFRRARAARPETTPDFFLQLSSASFVRTLRRAVSDGQRLLLGTSDRPVTGVSAELLQPGRSKVAVKVSVTLEGVTEPLEFVVAKGAISADEAALYAELGPKDITQKLLVPLVEGIDGGQAMLVTEFVPFRSSSPGVPGYIELFTATADADYAAAIGALDARLWTRTFDPATRTAKYNHDLHLKNINVGQRGGATIARAVDFASEFTHQVPEDVFWATTLMRRSPQIEDFSGAVRNFDAYLDGAFEAAVADQGEAAATALFGRISTALKDPNIKARAELVQESLTIEDASLRVETSNLFEAWLARHRPQAARPGLAVVQIAPRLYQSMPVALAA
ncbi:MAG TPA: hypothetical protein VH741_06040, partial [Candidatus Limnocylindrales bacterium]